MKLQPEGSFDCLGINTLTHLPDHFLRLPLTHSALLSLMPRSPSFPPRPANAPLVSRRPAYLQATKQQSDGDESHGTLDLFFSFPSALVLAARDACLSCLGASRLSSILAGPTQPVSSHDAHRLTLQYNLLGAVTPPHISHFTSSQWFPIEVITETSCVTMFCCCVSSVRTHWHVF